VKAIAGFVICTLFSVIVGAFLLQEKYKEINFVIIGSIAGFFLGFLLYSFLCGVFITGSSTIMWSILLASSAFGIYLVHVIEDNEHLASILIGAYLIIRGLSFLFGGFPNEADVFTQLSDAS
jgi:hypothetical protein